MSVPFLHKPRDNILAKAFSLLDIQTNDIVMSCNAISIAILRIEIILGSFIDRCFSF